ncbi:MAG: 30S ribosomal protein S13 [Patescibacteria group bacterium]|nr:30S ribosomal protein S13 [Patescibacteria group bacterium]
MRLFGVNLPDEKKIHYALTLVYGIGWRNVYKILKEANVDSQKRVREVTEEEFKKISEVIEKNYKIEGALREEIAENINRLKQIGAYRGIRHIRNLPVRGQRTRSNARTKRGKRKTVGALRKEVWAKLESSKSSSAGSKESK